MNEDNVLFKGGVHIKGVKPEWVYKASQIIANYGQKVSEDELNIIHKIEDPDKVLIIRTNSAGDFSTYELWLVKSADSPQLPPENFDTILSHLRFSFKIECPNNFDCISPEICSPEKYFEPALDYMAKDYASFRRLMLDRLSLIMPEWKERNSADIGMVLVELLAYVGDHLSYYQDAVGTEAYLGTARRRISARRHARLLDYIVHDGCNSRVWICIYADADNEIKLPKKTILLTSGNNSGSNNQSVKNEEVKTVKEEELETELAKGAQAFETMYEITLYKSNNEVYFYTWGGSECWLPAGSTAATINANTLTAVDVFIWEKVPGNDTDKLIQFLKSNFNLRWIDRAEIIKKGDDVISIANHDNELEIKLDSDKSKAILSIGDNDLYEFNVKTSPQNNDVHEVKSFSIKIGDVLILSEILSPETGRAPDPTHRHAIRLTSVRTGVDVLNDTKVLEITWDQEDALPFALCLEKGGRPISIAHGNIVLADHGYTINAEKLQTLIAGGRYYPKLGRKPLTQRAPDFEITSLDISISAASAFNYDIRDVKPDIYLERNHDLKRWHPQKDLLVSDEFAHEFVVEMETDGTAYIRFNNSDSRDWAEQILNTTTTVSAATTTNDFEPFLATYRIGNGLRGNVGPYSINTIVVKRNATYKGEGLKTLFNPNAASGGQEPEALENIRQYAPQALRIQQRAVTESDYTDILKRLPQIQKAVAIKRWTGSWYTIFVSIDRSDGLPVDNDFKTEMVKFLNKYRLAGYDIEVNGPVYVPLRIVLDICLKPGYFASEVKLELLRVFSSRTQVDGKKSFFHTDNFTFGQPLYLSQVYETAMKIQGVLSVIVKVFQRWGKRSNNELDTGVIKVGMLEIIRLDNDANFAENGIIDFNFINGSI